MRNLESCTTMWKLDGANDNVDLLLMLKIFFDCLSFSHKLIDSITHLQIFLNKNVCMYDSVEKF